jgi:uncharacterized protein with FMN-binding domain
MNKFLSSSFLVIVFAIYAFSKHVIGANGVVAVLPQSSSSIASSDASSFATVWNTEESSDPPLATIPVDTPSSLTPIVLSSSSAPVVASSSAQTQSEYKDGVYSGASENAHYGNVQVSVTLQSGQITDISFLDYPQHQHESEQINSYAMPQLISEAIQSQSAQVDTVSGATFTSRAFAQSLASALTQAHS